VKEEFGVGNKFCGCLFYRTRGVIARRSERERKRAVEALEKAGEFVPLDMLEAIPNPEKTTTDADIELQLQEALVSTIAAIDLSLDDSFCATEAEVETKAIRIVTL
jgi:hypothetical protein